jgi:antitoxin ParD1/3/4
MKEALSLTLKKNEVSFLSEMVKSGRFASRAEVIRAGLRLLEDYEYHQKAKRLQVLIAQGDADIKAGRMTEYASAKELADAIRGKS